MTPPDRSVFDPRELRRLAEAATPGPWECKDAPHAPFDGEFRVLGPYFETHVKGQSFDDRHWICFMRNYHNAALTAYLRTHVDAIIALAEGHTAVRDKALEEAAEICEVNFRADGRALAEGLRALKGAPT